jgi:hypothetical protein
LGLAGFILGASSADSPKCPVYVARLLFLSQTLGGGGYVAKARTSAIGLALIVCCLIGCGDSDVPSAPRVLSLSPKRAALTTFQTQQFQAIQRNDALSGVNYFFRRIDS